MSSVASDALAQGLYRQTPLIQSEPLTKLVGKEVYLKLDCLQASGSFKDRGVAHLIYQEHMKRNKKGSSSSSTRIVSSSGGNAGLAAATVAGQLHLDCTVVVPVTTKELVVQKLRALGATVQVTGENWNAADAVAQDLISQDKQAVYVPPYEHPELWTGHSTVVDEIVSQLPETTMPSTIILSVGGGGLLCGVLEGLERRKVTNCRVIAAETVGASSFAQAWEQPPSDAATTTVVRLDRIYSIATSLGALQVSPTALQRARDYQRGQVQPAVCTDAEAVAACLQFAHDHRLLVEPACGASLAVLYSERLRKQLLLLDDDNDNNSGPIVVQVCGGSGVTLELLHEWKEQFDL